MFSLATPEHAAVVARCKANGILCDEDVLSTILSVFAGRHAPNLMPESEEARAVDLANGYYAGLDERVVRTRATRRMKFEVYRSATRALIEDALSAPASAETN